MRRLRKQAKEVLHGATKVYHYRRDLIPEGRLADLDKAVGEVRRFAGEKKPDANAFQASIDRLDGLLRKLGGKIYPKTFWNDNIEVALVAAIIVIGIRTFFFQPFIIPTNSMYPTYSGMNAVVYEAGESPSVGERALNFVTKGARHYKLEARNDGEIGILLRRNNGVPSPYYEVVDGRKWFGLFPAQFKEYVLLVGETPHRIRVPAEFSLESVISETLLTNGNRRSQSTSQPGFEVLLTKIRVEEGDTILEFDITLGDALFVDRISYHFRKPEVGEPFVFRTREIPGVEGGSNTFVDKYYIKRIAGVGGETLEIRDGALLVDGKPRDEVEAFERNAAREGEYDGYTYPNDQPNRPPPMLLTEEGHRITVPEKKYVALGDNSDNSLDSRYWGYVPEQAIVGKAIFIYYPFTRRWGPAE